MSDCSACSLEVLNGGSVSTVEVLCTPANCEEDILLLQVQAYGRAALVASYSLKQITKPYLDRE